MKSSYSPLGRTGLNVPPIIFGTSCLGNLYQALPYKTKLDIVKEIIRNCPELAVLDSAGKYGAGLALETIGRCLREIGVSPEQAIISNKLGWKRVPLKTREPSFEPGAWADLEYDAEQCISYEGILECYDQGCELLGDPYQPQLVSVHDPDEYLAASADETDRQQRWQDILDAYRALFHLKSKGKVAAVGIGAKDWTVIRDLYKDVTFDWVMLACSLTVYRHPAQLLEFVARLHSNGAAIVNSAVFNAGFLLGGKYFDYRIPDPDDAENKHLFEWRRQFLETCKTFDVKPAAACVQFGLSVPGVVAVALNTGKPQRISENVELTRKHIPEGFWQTLKKRRIMAADYPYLGT
ncbi:MAG: aldo/keto reductase [Candidatus Pacebacteria bacterium]|nr:aldo/keto reductase [Candidatus Paceibacterota bacterium]